MHGAPCQTNRHIKHNADNRQVFAVAHTYIYIYVYIGVHTVLGTAQSVSEEECLLQCEGWGERVIDE